MALALFSWGCARQNSRLEGRVKAGATIYAAKDGESLVILLNCLTGKHPLLPDHFSTASAITQGRILPIAAGTRVRKEGELVYRNKHALRVKVEEGAARGLTVLVPVQMEGSFTFGKR